MSWSISTEPLDAGDNETLRAALVELVDRYFEQAGWINASGKPESIEQATAAVEAVCLSAHSVAGPRRISVTMYGHAAPNHDGDESLSISIRQVV